MDLLQALITAREIIHLARVLMADQPRYVERAVAEMPAILDVINKLELADDRVVIYIKRGNDQNAFDRYMIFDRGTRYVMKTVPDWANEEDIVQLEQAEVGQELLLRLINKCESLRVGYPEIYEHINAGTILESVKKYYLPASEVEEYLRLKLSLLIANALRDINKSYVTDETIVQWAQSLIRDLEISYSSLQLAGNSIHRHLAVLYFISLSVNPATTYLVGTDWSDEIERNLSKLQETSEPISVHPAFDLHYYLDHPQMRGVQAVVPAKHTARVLRERAEDMLKDARSQHNLSRFYSSLYLASLYYRAAQYVYNVFAERAPFEVERFLSADVIKTNWTLCEEMRVTIGTSFDRGASVGPWSVPNVNDPKVFLDWLASLETLRKVDALNSVYDLELRLIFPTYIRDLAIGYLHLFPKLAIEKGKTYLMRSIKLLEENLEENILMVEPNYLGIAYGWLAMAYEEKGLVKPAKLYGKRSSPEYFEARRNGEPMPDFSSEHL